MVNSNLKQKRSLRLRRTPSGLRIFVGKEHRMANPDGYADLKKLVWLTQHETLPTNHALRLRDSNPDNVSLSNLELVPWMPAK
jgi:hypothetical protein